ncbi:MAG TPA: kelch repeat-containing protein [Terriglobales bacterium]|nr:kelch repeat-containing protein [Terriglobales bacterium]
MSGLRKLASAQFAQLTLALTLLTPVAYAQTKWSKLALFPEPAEEISGIVAAGKLYVFAGLAPVWKPMGMVYEYDPGTDKWTRKKPMALPSHHVAFATYRGKIYAFGGFVLPHSGPPAWVPINNAWQYDPQNDSWKVLAPLPTRRGSAVAATVGDKIYVIGGVTNPAGAEDQGISPTRPQLCLGTVEEYDPAANTWRERNPMPTPRNHAGVGVVDGKIYVIGGRVGAAFIGLASDVSVVEEYDPATNKWGAPRARMPTARSAMGVGVYGGHIYVAGGEYQDPHMMATFRAVERYDPATNTWTTMPSMPVSRHGLAAGIIGNRLHLVGGDVQSAGSGIDVSTGEHDVLEFPATEK